MSDSLLILGFILGAAVSLATSWLLVSRIERIGARLGLTEGLLGVLAALAADAPDVTAANSALAGHHAHIGSGVVIGSNVFNLAALLGVAALVAGGIALHRRVIVLEGVIAMAIAAICVLVVVGPLSPPVGLLLAVAVLGPYLVALGVHPDRLGRLGLPASWSRWLTAAIHEETLELEGAIEAPREGFHDVPVALVATAVVVGASIAMEQAASKFGGRHAVPPQVIGGLILAAVTSLPNAVAAVYLAIRGRGAASLSTAMNSNALNVVAGLLLPASFAGLGSPGSVDTMVALYYLGMTGFVLVIAYFALGLARIHGLMIIGVYAAFVGTLLAMT
jgi:cation:H+ antiporter